MGCRFGKTVGAAEVDVACGCRRPQRSGTSGKPLFALKSGAGLWATLFCEQPRTPGPDILHAEARGVPRVRRSLAKRGGHAKRTGCFAEPAKAEGNWRSWSNPPCRRREGQVLR